LLPYLQAEELKLWLTIVTHQLSIPEPGGCFQWRLFVCQFVGLFVYLFDVIVFVRTITSKWLNIRRSNLAVRYIVQTSCPSWNVNVKGQGHQEQKKRKTAESSPLTMHGKACAIGSTQQTATNNTIVWLLRGDRLCRLEKSAHAV